MKLISLKCPSCDAVIEVNKDFETAVCNYCRTEFLLEDENQTKEERIIITKAKMEEQAKILDRKYYASDDYKKKLDIEKETSFERIFRKIGEFDEKQRAFNNSEQGKKQRKLLIITLLCMAVFSFLIPFICLVVVDQESQLHCKLGEERYLLIIKEKEKIKCASCSKELLDELNAKYLDMEDVYTTKQNIEYYFINKKGSCGIYNHEEIDDMKN